MSFITPATGIDGGRDGGGDGDMAHRAIDTTTKFKIQENPYSNNVLLGNWFEERFSDKSDKKAITPCIYGQSDCVEEKPLYRGDFTTPTDLSNFLEWKLNGFRNRLNSESSNIKLWDGEQFERNATTMKDLMFRIVPEEREKRKGLLRRNEEDFLRSYGNSTKTGLLQWRACEEWTERRTPNDMTHYKNAFKQPVVTEKRVICKGPRKKTSII
ncbi:uncharacterized protein [Musca autumnalis]|uniref:uncharacterized protein n=1 Tax=Musca autumnalis TaxID=221902 RepID=UPI003CF341BE